MPDQPETTQPAVSEQDAWGKCPCEDLCRAAGLERPCLACWGVAGDIVAGLQLEKIQK